MKTPRSTADRIRPILEAMERSIETARRRRLHKADGSPSPRPFTSQDPRLDGNDVPRRKARPKRPMIRRFDGSEYRSGTV